MVFQGPAPPGAGMPRGPGGPPGGPGGPGSPLPGPGGPTPHGGFVPGPQYSRMPGTFLPLCSGSSIQLIQNSWIHHSTLFQRRRNGGSWRFWRSRRAPAEPARTFGLSGADNQQHRREHGSYGPRWWNGNDEQIERKLRNVNLISLTVKAQNKIRSLKSRSYDSRTNNNIP